MEHQENIATLPIYVEPVYVCASVLVRLERIWDELLGRSGGIKYRFIEDIFPRMYRSNDTGEQLEEELRQCGGVPDNINSVGLLLALFIAGAYACQGIKALAYGNTPLTGGYVAKSAYWVGVVAGALGAEKYRNNQTSAIASLGSDARHKENRSLKEYAINWYKEHAGEFSSKNNAAEAMAGKIVPVSFTTVRNWLKGV